MLKVTTAPDELITVTEAILFMRAETVAEEATLIASLIIASRQMCEEYLFRAIGVQTLEMRSAGFPASNGPIILPSPIISVTSIKYLDSSRVEQTMDAADYIVSDAEPAMVVPVSSWPGAYITPDSVRVVFSAGYDGGSSPATGRELPRTIRTAILMQVADLYENREAQTERPLTMNQTVERLLSTYRLEMGI
jgi:uncharacterized phiE125 gp8 family phage protein